MTYCQKTTERSTCLSSKQSTYFFLGGIEEFIEKSYVVKAYTYLLGAGEKEGGRKDRRYRLQRRVREYLALAISLRYTS